MTPKRKVKEEEMEMSCLNCLWSMSDDYNSLFCRRVQWGLSVDTRGEPTSRVGYVGHKDRACPAWVKDEAMCDYED